jgi:5-bromo-4-chloroindolyl phosphate hydrolysis protein
MEDLVEKYINSNTYGVKIAEMEETLQQSRLRLGYVTRKLLNEGRVQKIENRYYPINNNHKQLNFKK